MPSEFQQVVQQLLTTFDVPGASIALVSNYELAEAEGYGCEEHHLSRVITRDTIFQACSLSKPVTAVAALHLVKSGVLDLDIDLNGYLTSWQIPGVGHVTLRHLLSHTAGLTYCWYPGYRRHAPLPTFSQILMGQPPSNTPAIRIYRTPGTSFRYSGSHYAVIQQIITDRLQVPFPTAMHQLVFAPLHMRHSSYDQAFPEQQEAVASGHYLNGLPVHGKWRVMPTMASAGLWTTPSDIARLIIEIQQAYIGASAKLLDQNIAISLLTRQTPLAGPNWGLGFALISQDNRIHFQHGGSNIGYKCWLEANNKDAVVIMTNSERGDEALAYLLHHTNWAKQPARLDWRPSLRQRAIWIGLHSFSRYAAFRYH